MNPTRRVSFSLITTLVVVLSSILALATAGPAHSAAECQVTDAPGDDQYASIAKRVQAFGGFYVDGSALNVWLTDGGESLDAAVQEILSLPGHSDLADLTPVALRGRYSFLQLFCWFYGPMLHLGPIPGIVFEDIDEARNRLTIAIEDLATQGPIVKARLADVGIPLEAVDIIEEEPIMFLPGPGGSTAYLQSPPPEHPLHSPQRGSSIVGVGLVLLGIASVAVVSWRERKRSIEERATP